MFPLQQRAWVQLVRPQLKDAALSPWRRRGEERELLAELLRTRREVRNQLVVCSKVLFPQEWTRSERQWNGSPVRGCARTNLGILDHLRGLIIPGVILVLENVDYCLGDQHANAARMALSRTEHVLVTNHSLPASGKFHVQSGIILDASVVRLSNADRRE